MTEKRVLFVVTSHDRKGDKPSGFYLSEVTHTHKVLTDAGYSIDFVSPKGGKAPVDPDSLDLTDELNQGFWSNPVLRDAIGNTMRPTEVNVDHYAGIFFAGGHAAMWDLPDDIDLANITARIHDRGGIVGAVCHGPAGLLNVKRPDGELMVKDMFIAAFTNDEERAAELDGVIPFSLADELKKRGARHDCGPNWQKKVVISERIVTGQNPASATAVGDAMVTLMQNAQH